MVSAAALPDRAVARVAVLLVTVLRVEAAAAAVRAGRRVLAAVGATVLPEDASTMTVTPESLRVRPDVRVGRGRAAPGRRTRG